MSKDVLPGMTQARFATIVDSYGGDPKRWPSNERDAAELWLASNPQAQTLLLQAINLDRSMLAAPVESVSAEFERRLLNDFDRSRQRWSVGRLVSVAVDAVWPGAPLWQPACAFALALAIGLAVGAFAPFDIPQQDEAFASAFTLDGAPDVDEGPGV
jgi:hypothetical protein